MPKQIAFAQAEYEAKRKTTGRDRFLAEMESVVPWARLLEAFRPRFTAAHVAEYHRDG